MRTPTGHTRVVVGGDGPVTVYLEPEGKDVFVPEGDWLLISFPGPYVGDIEIGHHPTGISVVRPDGPTPTVVRKDGTSIPW